MIALPAIDLRGGACVQLVGGSPSAERVRLDAGLALQRFLAAGLRTFHLVDLDAALGTGDNRSVVAQLLATKGCRFSVGGGVRSSEEVARLLSLGAARVVVGTRALEEPAWLVALARRFPGRIALAADVRGNEVVVRGWQRGAGLTLAAALDAVADLPLASVLVTAVHVEGQERGPDLTLIRQAAQATALPIHAAGGVSSLEDLRALEAAGAAAAVIGMALYTGKLDLTQLAQEFGQ